ncbi:hypothetical protein GUITHDRAFT_102526 [Guillardia theta CCMP2712]|uniref:Uncharacterized protein n=1 Tax=Guillardia theta (strain CCMP2712) TaxID=905079 RepID=L1JV02_GUITC|nr:hypothetical protein GUITHDRAFT_102526 [Guillardia theta CCMP2712]EKX51913.1 hypothetical protein GUITHDRAFT_102526 [Guillardia theta CCMP2712]|eukprot:XP_005838893.1 hypothetical protein GUITHDRAFT_102526 [Guillardia theta CCMP2712]
MSSLTKQWLLQQRNHLPVHKTGVRSRETVAQNESDVPMDNGVDANVLEMQGVQRRLTRGKAAEAGITVEAIEANDPPFREASTRSAERGKREASNDQNDQDDLPAEGQMQLEPNGTTTSSGAQGQQGIAEEEGSVKEAPAQEEPAPKEEEGSEVKAEAAGEKPLDWGDEKMEEADETAADTTGHDNSKQQEVEVDQAQPDEADDQKEEEDGSRKDDSVEGSELD